MHATLVLISLKPGCLLLATLAATAFYGVCGTGLSSSFFRYLIRMSDEIHSGLVERHEIARFGS